MQRRSLLLLLLPAVATADDAVCALPASALFLPVANASAPLARCWSESAGVTVFAPCASACACRRLEVSAGLERGACLNTTAGFRCSDGGGTDCSAFVLNTDGSSTLRSRASAETPPPPSSWPAEPELGAAGSGAAMIPSTIARPKPSTSPVHATATSERDGDGLAAWAYALIAVALVLGVALAICWRRRRGRRKCAADVFERTESVDTWKDAAVLEAEAARAPVMAAPPPPPLPPASRLTTTSTATTAFTPEPALNLAVVAGVSSYHTYRLGPSDVRSVAARDDDDDGDDLSSVALHSPPRRDSYSSRRSSASALERLTGGSRLSYASVSSYGSEMDSFSSQLTFNDSEPRDTEPASDAHYHATQRFFGADTPPYPRKQSTEF